MSRSADSIIPLDLNVSAMAPSTDSAASSSPYFSADVNLSSNTETNIKRKRSKSPNPVRETKRSKPTEDMPTTSSPMQAHQTAENMKRKRSRSSGPIREIKKPKSSKTTRVITSSPLQIPQAAETPAPGMASATSGDVVTSSSDAKSPASFTEPAAKDHELRAPATASATPGDVTTSPSDLANPTDSSKPATRPSGPVAPATVTTTPSGGFTSSFSVASTAALLATAMTSAISDVVTTSPDPSAKPDTQAHELRTSATNTATNKDATASSDSAPPAQAPKPSYLAEPTATPAKDICPSSNEIPTSSAMPVAQFPDPPALTKTFPTPSRNITSNSNAGIVSPPGSKPGSRSPLSEEEQKRLSYLEKKTAAMRREIEAIEKSEADLKKWVNPFVPLPTDWSFLRWRTVRVQKATNATDPAVVALLPAMVSTVSSDVDSTLAVTTPPARSEADFKIDVTHALTSGNTDSKSSIATLQNKSSDVESKPADIGPITPDDSNSKLPTTRPTTFSNAAFKDLEPLSTTTNDVERKDPKPPATTLNDAGSKLPTTTPTSSKNDDSKPPDTRPNTRNESDRKSRPVIYHTTGTQTFPTRENDAIYKRIYGREKKVSDTQRYITVADPTELKYGPPFFAPVPDTNTTIETEDRGFQIMDYEYREVFLCNAKTRAVLNAEKLRVVGEKQGQRIYAETRDEMIVHSSQIPLKVAIEFEDGGRTLRENPTAPNLLYASLRPLEKVAAYVPLEDRDDPVRFGEFGNTDAAYTDQFSVKTAVVDTAAPPPPLASSKKRKTGDELSANGRTKRARPDVKVADGDLTVVAPKGGPVFTPEHPRYGVLRATAPTPAPAQDAYPTPTLTSRERKRGASAAPQDQPAVAALRDSGFSIKGKGKRRQRPPRAGYEPWKASRK